MAQRVKENSETTSALNSSAIRKDFPILERRVHGKQLVYFDNAATSQRPRQVIEALNSYYTESNANIHRAVHTLSHESSVAYEQAHKKIAKFVHARSWREIVFTRNATESMNIVAYGWALPVLNPGDEIVVTIMEHHSNIVPWFMLRDKKQVCVKFVDVDEQGRLELASFKKAITSKTKLVGMIYASNVLGVINPIHDMIEIAKKAGALTLVDAAQAVPHMPVDVQALDCDFLVASGHKMLAPSGTGFLYAKRELLQQMEPFLFGGDMISTVTTDGATWNELPWKFEAGTPSIADGIGFGVAVDYLNALGMDKVFLHEQELLHYGLEQMKKTRGVTLYGPPDADDRVGVISFNVNGIHPHDLAGLLDEEGIAVRSGHHCAQPLMKRLKMDNTARASFYIYNTKDEIDLLIAGIKKAQKIFQV